MSTEQYPPFCIQAFAQADNDAPLIDLATEKVTFDNAYTKMGDTAKGTINVGNYGVDPVAAPKLYYSVGGGQPVEVSVSGTIKPNNTQQYSFEVPTKDLAEGKFPSAHGFRPMTYIRATTASTPTCSFTPPVSRTKCWLNTSPR